jgi:hypothetical protein
MVGKATQVAEGLLRSSDHPLFSGTAGLIRPPVIIHCPFSKTDAL